MSAIAGISYERGKELVHIQDEAVDTDDFSDYLVALAEQHSQRKIAIFIDNLRVHHTDDVVEMCEALDIMVIYNKPYSPDFNAIEFVFSAVKNHYKRERFHHENNSIPYQIGDLIERAFRVVKTAHVRNCINYAMR